jgi:hypothetical protein
VVENAFGILANHWRVFTTKIHLQPETVDKIVLACTVLHNVLRDQCGDGPGEHGPTLAQAALPRSTNTTLQAKRNRDILCNYMCSDAGAVAWQWDKM